ncbi:MULTISPECIES: hypothetical protein [unclassified Rhodococcus (in: high G+C Gram-positive bacteria)]|jgi:hypothetical protein|uniref:hypothetical protein n=1 Tax=unclassified Rhodococcus (in: high G+C Gram-positive bacteria) TaxID=192944 RepID=UPI00165D96F5|nr:MULTISPECIES: hypothetical protein [unclassified Rhodococcus (in: high G+C Gram-positive bacteria)]MDI9926445.1 hypothetical protein [Rhodococcus sp. IEGM 1341]
MSTSNRPSGLHVLLRSSWRRWLVVVVVVVVAVSVVLIHRFDGSSAAGTAEVTVGQDPPTYDQQRRADVTVLLDQWARAVRSGDLDALRDVMDPQADPGFVEAQLRRAAVVPGVPFAEFGYDLGDEPETPVPPPIAAALDSTDVWAPSVYLRYAVTGPDASPTRRPVSLVVAERDGRWRLVDDADLTEYRRHTWRGPWDFGPLTVRSVATAAGTSVVMGHPDRDRFVENLAAELPSAIAAVTDFWGDDWARDGLVFVASSAEEFAELTGSDPSTDVAAVTVSDAVAADGSRPTGQRVVFGPDAASRLTPFTVRSVLRHELTHVAARARTSDDTELWVSEGFADYSGYRGSGAEFAQLAPTLAAIVAAGGPPTVLPKNEDFGAGGVRSSVAYESAWSVFAFVADRFGESTLRSLYEALASESPTDSAFESVLGLDRAQFVSSWGDWVARQAR